MRSLSTSKNVSWPHLIWPTLYTHQAFNGHIKTAAQWTIVQKYSDWFTGRWWMGLLLHLVQRGGGLGGLRPRPVPPPRCTKCNSPPINGQCTNL